MHKISFSKVSFSKVNFDVTCHTQIISSSIAYKESFLEQLIQFEQLATQLIVNTDIFSIKSHTIFLNA